MSSIQRVTVDLPTELLERLQMSVQDGEYLSTGEVIYEALQEWAARREPDPLGALRAAIALGMEGESISAEDVYAKTTETIEAHRNRR